MTRDQLDTGALRESCTECDWDEVWDGGTAAEDPGLQHAKDTGHKVKTVVNDA